jgi:hypothetical protein
MVRECNSSTLGFLGLNRRNVTASFDGNAINSDLVSVPAFRQDETTEGDAATKTIWSNPPSVIF